MYVSTLLSMARISCPALSLLVLCSSLPALGQNDGGSGTDSRRPLPEYVQEFFLSDAVRCQEKGELQITSGVDSRQQLGTSTWLKMEYGVTNRLQLGFDLPYGMTEEEKAEGHTTWSTAGLGLEYQIIRSESPFALSVGMKFDVPVKAGRKVEYEPTILVAKTFRRAQVHASFVADIEERNPAFQYNLASVYPVQRRWFPILEFNGRRLNGGNASYLTPGLYRRLKHRVELGVGAPLGFGGKAGGVGLVGKVNWEIGGDHESE
jgi:hypothetical protein